MPSLEMTTQNDMFISRVCLNEMLHWKQLANGPCMLAAFSKILGIVLIGTMTIGQIPQIVKILRKRSASGVSLFSILLMLQASSSTVAYAIYKRFPVSTWGENIVLMHENVVLICLLLRYSKRARASLSFLLLFIIYMLVLLWPTIPGALLWGLYVLSMPAILASRAIQMFKNHRTKNPGQLSATSSFLCIFQGFGRLTTSIIITGDYVMIYTFAAVSLFNVLLFLQVLYYRWRLKKMA